MRRAVQVHEPFRLAARVEMHLPGGCKRVLLFAIDRGDIRQDIPTEAIPLHLRPIGSEFLVVLPRFTVEATDSPEAVRAVSRKMQVEVLSHGA